MAFLKLDYDIAIAQAGEIRKAGDKCYEIANCISKQLSEIETSWEGGTERALKSKLESMQKEYKEIGDSLKKSADKIVSKANQIKISDEKK